MENKMTLVEFKNYIKKEAEKLYKITLLKEEKEKLEFELSILKESTPPLELGVALMDPETLQKVRQEMLKKASGWAVPEPKQQLDENAPDPMSDPDVFPTTGNKMRENQESNQMYTFNVKHDKGSIKIKTNGSSAEEAKKKIAAAEGAPESAITLVKEESNN